MSLANPFRTLVLAATLGALALPAAAESVKVNIAGLDAKAAHAKIVSAAETACSLSQAGETLRYYTIPSCVDEAVAATEAKFAANEHRYAAVPATGR